ncbi:MULTISPECIES: DUF2304 domain-containing protein [Arthrobacter]|uniref:DUF2304 domain-containing protein n=1 Tax=Arthrobacter jinronghuae TaxID=2964609 RepID=A0ABT1NP43_9MICC|nr:MULTISPECIES: DUF2304 domain-containing protein [Arthrobacter]MCQ1949503.1 DUF2304 domain-containing protein [Arthrobacter jinronghuae]MCQ1952823.1 DUF2304 domain-containing protein [Arthrobacter sp. zg-Y238]MCQ1955056.1 DUF2304 domain-containing protein [Arthrobacter jinronghuae]UWX77726.1 DUF2304 domain-containing protein [Arthrobacter jinronghuae]
MAVFAAFVFSLVMFVLVLEMLRRKKLREKYAVLWLLVGGGSLILAGWPQLLALVAGWLGVQVPSNLLFAMSIVLLIGVALHLSWELSVVEDETRILAEEVAILNTALKQLQGEVRSPKDPGQSGTGTGHPVPPAAGDRL